MKKVLKMSMVLGIITFSLSQAQAYAIGGVGCSTGIDCATAVTSLPSFVIADQKVDQNSAEFKAMAYSEAIRTIKGRRTLLFGNNIVNAQAYIDAIANQNNP